MKESDVVKECKALLDAHEAAGEAKDMEWLIEELLSAHSQIDGADKDFALLAMHTAANPRWFKMARRSERIKPDGTDDRQGVIPGYEHIQRTYAVTRDGRQQSVPLDKMTSEEIREKIADYQRISKGSKEHAEELARYLEEREAR